ncbi:class I SAM-dependent methyltransferase [Desulfohalovibrio reitneri]|uniref:class I SAM-dependent methyltransferase n=1 Tax=Desulfohalovibrio reitneri TaxID=1307759 RepID=UPI000691A40F|nr:class I SAM-dependent methyltransferase [Desulfohalovibrio reitneri]
MINKVRLDAWRKRWSRDERPKVERVLEGLDRSLPVLEAGCGYGAKLELLRSLGFTDLTGVEINPRAREAVRAKGFRVLSPDELAREGREYGLLVMAHVIEHFDWRDLLDFTDPYLERLAPGGRCLILAPLPHPLFHEDFDHVQPYFPQTIKVLFGEGDDQTQAVSRHVLKLRDVYFRRSPFRRKTTRARLLKRGDAPDRMIDAGLALLFRASFGVVGRRTGWIGLFEKKASRSG